MRGELRRQARNFAPKDPPPLPDPARRSVVRPCFYFVGMSKRPSRLDLLELDIDLRLTDLWREAIDVSEWNLEVVAAFLRAAYGKGYCDALTEDAPGSLCHEHGYRIPDRAPAKRAAEPDKRAA
jgi:hypothetical protein